MHPFAGANIIVLDLETLHSAADLATGWHDKAALGLSIGCYYDYTDDRCHWFDVHTLEETMRQFVDRQPMLVSFNGIGFDFPLMCAVLRQKGEHVSDDSRVALDILCTAFEDLIATSYDILAEIWASDPVNKFAKGLNSLDAVLWANQLPPKTGTGPQAPHWWQEGRIAEVLNYCQQDVLSTKVLCELISDQLGTIYRTTGPLAIRWLDNDSMIQEVWDDPPF